MSLRISLLGALLLTFSLNAKENFSTLDCSNDDICSPVDFGTIAFMDTLGDPTQGIYDNHCATNDNEPNPFDFRGFWNDAGVWFTFTTDDNPGPLVIIDAINDPEGIGDDINLQIAIYEAVDGDCNGRMDLIKNVSPNDRLDARLVLDCPKPNTNYYILIDGSQPPSGNRWGVFGITVFQPPVQEAGDLICDADFLGVVPENGSIDSGGRWSNFCATDTGDPHTSSFQTQVGVWFEFIAPPSGHVWIEGTADSLTFPLNMQVGVFGSSNNQCDGPLIEFGSSYDGRNSSESLEVRCLHPGNSYWILVDGFGSGGIGVFDLLVRDAGDITPRVNVDTTLCAGSSINVGSSTYFATGSYVDTINLYEGCDSIVFTQLTVLDSIQLSVNVIQAGIGPGQANGSAEVLVTGGTGNYNITWCNGVSGAINNTLIGNRECCIEVMDDLGCFNAICFTMPLETVLIPAFEGSVLRCHDEKDGTISFTVENGVPPYTYAWQSLASDLNGSGVIVNDEDPVEVNNLPGGLYEVYVNDNFGDTTFTIQVEEPDPITIQVNDQTNVSCYGACDGIFSFEVNGGTGTLDVQILDLSGNRNNASALCGGNYFVLVSDEQGCVNRMPFVIEEPEQFDAQLVVENEISCYEGNDGHVSVTTNGRPISYFWSNGAITSELRGIPAGTYEVTVTNEDGCKDSTIVDVNQPESPVEVGITVEQPIQCYDFSNGQLLASVIGPGETFNFLWSNGNQNDQINGLSEGQYWVRVSNEFGCTATDTFFLMQPEPINATVESQQVTCLDDFDNGAIYITDITGGNASFLYSIGGTFQSNAEFTRLSEGDYTISIRDKAGCLENFETSVDGPASLSVELGSDVKVFLGDSVVLSPQYNGNNLMFQWFERANFLLESPVSQQSFVPTEKTRYSVVIKDTISHCTATDDIIVTIDKTRRIFLPTAFSPNGDGNNDELMLFGGNEIAGVEVFRVFSRNGALIYEAQNFTPEDPVASWDGTFNGQPLTTGVYVYYAVIDFIDGKSELFTGDVVLMR